MRVSKDLEKHVRKGSVFRHSLEVKKPEPKQKSILAWEHRDEVPHSWDRRVSPGFTFSNLDLPDPDYEGDIRNLQNELNRLGSRESSVERRVTIVERQVEYVYETYLKEVSLSADEFGRPNVNPPTMVIQDNISLDRFTLNTDRLFFKFPIPADYDSGNVDLRPIWTNDGGNDDDGRTVRWQLRYQIGALGLPVDGTLGTLNSDDSYVGVAGWIEHHGPYVSISPAEFANRLCFYIRVMAVTPPGAALTCEPHLLGICLRWTARRLV